MFKRIVPESSRVCNGGTVPPIFRILNAAIAHAHNEGDQHTCDLLLAAKYGAVIRHHALLEEGR